MSPARMAQGRRATLRRREAAALSPFHCWGLGPSASEHSCPERPRAVSGPPSQRAGPRLVMPTTHRLGPRARPWPGHFTCVTAHWDTPCREPPPHPEAQLPKSAVSSVPRGQRQGWPQGSSRTRPSVQPRKNPGKTQPAYGDKKPLGQPGTNQGGRRPRRWRPPCAASEAPSAAQVPVPAPWPHSPPPRPPTARTGSAGCELEEPPPRAGSHHAPVQRQVPRLPAASPSPPSGRCPPCRAEPATPGHPHSTSPRWP